MLLLEFVLCTEFDWGPQRSLPSHGFLPGHHGDYRFAFSSVVRSRAHSGPPKTFEAQGGHRVISHHIVTYFVREEADKLASSVREMGWMQLNHSLVLSILLIFQAPTCFSACSSFCDTRILYFPLKNISFLFPVSPACCCFSTPNF